MDKKQEIIDKVCAWRDESDNNTAFCLLGEKNRENGYLYTSSVGGNQAILSHMIYTEMKRDKNIAEAVSAAVEVYKSEQ